jgi:Uma2 family endonuclease
MSVAERKMTGAAPARPRRVNYPESDGKPMAENSEHRDAMTYAIQAAQEIFDNTAYVWISGNDFVYYVEGDPTKRVSPDCYVVLGVPRRARRSFKVWEEGGKIPNIVFEFTSRKTARQDREEKFDLYERELRIPEYFLFDPLSEYLRPRLQGYRLTNGVYQPILPAPDGRLVSPATGITVFADGTLLRFVDPRTGNVVLTRAEAQRKIAEEAQACHSAEAEIARLQAELEALRNQRGNASGS